MLIDWNGKAQEAAGAAAAVPARSGVGVGIGSADGAGQFTAGGRDVGDSERTARRRPVRAARLHRRRRRLCAQLAARRPAEGALG